MAAEQPAQGQKQAATDSMPLKGDYGVVGTGWGKAAGPGEQGRNKELVETNKVYTDRLHDTLLPVNAIGNRR